MTRHLKSPSAPAEHHDEKCKKEKNKYLNTAQAAEYLGVHPSFLEQRRQKTRPDLMRQSPVYFRRGRKISYTILDLDRWLEARRVDPENRAGREGPADE